jgi:hypothetical protein
MKYQVVYKKPKKKGITTQQVATFFDIESAFYWQDIIKSQGASEIEIIVKG